MSPYLSEKASEKCTALLNAIKDMFCSVNIAGYIPYLDKEKVKEKEKEIETTWYIFTYNSFFMDA